MSALDPNRSNTANSTALFIDIENLIGSASSVGLPIDLAPVADKLLQYGRLSIRRSFGDLDSACRGNWPLKRQVRNMLHENLVQIEDVPYVTGFKNTADIRLVVDALSVAFTYPDINQFAIVASDRDYRPLIAKLRELGKTVIGIGGTPDTVNKIYVNACDEFVYYSTLFTTAQSSPESDLAASDTADLDTYLQLLCKAVSIIEQRGGKAVGAQIVPLMRQMRPDYDPALVGLKSLRDLMSVAKARGLVTGTAHGADLLLSLVSDTSLRKPAPQQPVVDFANPAAAATAYRDFLHTKLKCEILAADIRQRIYQVLDTTLQDIEQKQQPMELGDLSAMITDSLVKTVPQLSPTSVFKLLYSLFRVRAFEAEPGMKPFRPRIIASKKTDDSWDDLFILNCMILMMRERSDWPVNEEALSRVFGVTIHAIQRITSKAKLSTKTEANGDATR